MVPSIACIRMQGVRTSERLCLGRGQWLRGGPRVWDCGRLLGWLLIACLSAEVNCIAAVYAMCVGKGAGCRVAFTGGPRGMNWSSGCMCMWGATDGTEPG